MSEEYQYEILNCFKEGVILVKTEQQAESLTRMLKKVYGSPYTYKKRDEKKKLKVSV